MNAPLGLEQHLQCDVDCDENYLIPFLEYRQIVMS